MGKRTTGKMFRVIAEATGIVTEVSYFLGLIASLDGQRCAYQNMVRLTTREED